MRCAAYTTWGAHGERSWEVLLMPSRMRRRPKAHTWFPWVILAASPARMAPLSSQPYLTHSFALSTWAARCRLCPRCGRIRPSYSAGQAGEKEGTPVLPPASPSLLGQGAVCQDGGAERIRPLGCAGRTWGNTASVSPGFGFIVWLVVGFWFFVVVVFPPPLSLYFSSCHPKSLFFSVSAAGHLVSHMDGVILEESPRESLLKPPFVLEVEKSIVVHEKDLDKIRTVSIQDCLISP